jgi:glycosyltransferase involved in cell wall biosynthesis
MHSEAKAVSKHIAVLIPCYNEELTIGDVVSTVREQLPEAKLYVFDNNSTDRTAAVALESGAEVIKVKQQGKGFVVQSMFRLIDADIYIMVDGDNTYDLSEIRKMVALIVDDAADMVVGSRLKHFTANSFRPLHMLGNKLVKSLINRLFGANLQDIMSGLRIMNRDFIKNINITAKGFEVETEMTIKALKYSYVIREMDVRYSERPAGSFSKLNTYKDGLLVLKTIFIIFKDYKPLLFFNMLALLMLLVSLTAGSVVIDEYISTRFVSHVPLAILASGSMILSMIFFITGIILDATSRRFDELYYFLRSKD